MQKATLLIQCPDGKGIVAKVSQFVFSHGGNIVSSDQHSTDPDGGHFFMRVEFCFEEDQTSTETLEAGFEDLAGSLRATWEIHYDSRVMNMAIAVSQYDHCLVDLLYRVSHGELRVNIPLVVSNHETARGVVEQHGIPFHYLPVTKETRREQENQIMALLEGKSDFLVLARYMRILTKEFLDGCGPDMINIHHSFLPSFKGANPYRQAYDRGVKIIGATAHYVTLELDEGPIIAQAVEPVSHRDTVETLKQKGRGLEQRALAAAIQAHVEHRIIRYGNKTIVFK